MAAVESSRSAIDLGTALVIGAALVLVALVLAEFGTFPEEGHRINTKAWPSEAQAILKESPGVPISAGQWRRINQALAPYGGSSYGQKPYWAKTVRASWWWFVGLPLAAVAVLLLARRLPNSTAAAVLGPSVAVLCSGLVLSAGGP